MNADKTKIAGWVAGAAGLFGLAFVVITRGGWASAGVAVGLLIYAAVLFFVGIPEGLEAQRVYRQRKAAAAAVGAAGVACVGVIGADGGAAGDQAQQAGQHAGLTARGEA